jgi:hypothetical protein
MRPAHHPSHQTRRRSPHKQNIVSFPQHWTASLLSSAATCRTSCLGRKAASSGRQRQLRTITPTPSLARISRRWSLVVSTAASRHLSSERLKVQRDSWLRGGRKRGGQAAGEVQVGVQAVVQGAGEWC